MQRYTYVRNLFNIQLAVKPDIYRCICFQSDRLDFVCNDSDYFLRKDDRQADCPFSFRSSSSSVFLSFSPPLYYISFHSVLPLPLSSYLSLPLSITYLSIPFFLFLCIPIFLPPFSPPLYYISFHSVNPNPVFLYLSLSFFLLSLPLAILFPFLSSSIFLSLSLSLSLPTGEYFA